MRRPLRWAMARTAGFRMAVTRRRVWASRSRSKWEWTPATAQSNPARNSGS